MKKRMILALVLLVAGLQMANARPAYPGKIVYKQPDGKKIVLQRHGDEFCHWTTDAAGKVVKLDADGFTAYVGDKPFTLSAYPQPNLPRPEVTWFVGDSASLSVSGDTLTCEFTALKPSGKNELIVRCYGAETTIPVYLWEK